MGFAGHIHSSSESEIAHDHVATPKGRLLSPSEVAERLGVSERTLASWRHGDVRSTSGPRWIPLSAGAIRYAERDLEAWLRRRRRVT